MLSSQTECLHRDGASEQTLEPNARHGVTCWRLRQAYDCQVICKSFKLQAVSHIISSIEGKRINFLFLLAADIPLESPVFLKALSS